MPAVHGFTLIEAMITLSILAILLSLAAPGFHNFIQNRQIRSAAEAMTAGLNLARSEALRRNENVTLWIVDSTDASCALSSGGRAWVVSLDNPAGACDAAPSTSAAPRLVQSRPANESGSAVTVASVNSGGMLANCISFNGFGRPLLSCPGGALPLARVSLSAAGATAVTRALRVQVTSGGATRMCDPALVDTANPTACN